MLKVGDVVYVAKPDEKYEAEYGVRYHKSFFGVVTEISNFRDENVVDVHFPKTATACDMEWSYNEAELALASDLKNLTLEEFSNRFGVTVTAEYIV